MPSLGSILQIAKTGLQVAQQGMNVTAHNLANATTEGYSRQRILTSGRSLHLPEAVYGIGVRVADVQRIGDQLLDRAFYREVGGASEHQTRAGVLERVEGLFGEPSETGLGAAFDAFYSAFSDLATNPAAPTVRASVRQAATALVQKFQDLAGGLDVLRQEVEGRIQTGVEKVNSLLDDIGRLNAAIVAQESGGATAGDLRDSRGRRVTELAQLLPIQVIERSDGSVGISSSGIGIVDGAFANTLEVSMPGGVFAIGLAGGGATFSQVGGMIGGLLDLVNDDLPTIRQELDDLAEALVTEVNAVHVTGTNPTGATGISFFDPAGTTTSGIALSADVLASADAIAAGTPDGGGAYRAGANDVALVLAGLRDTDAPTLGTTMAEHYKGLVFDVGNGVRSSVDAAQVHQVLSDQADVRRMSLSGVSIDEELVKLIEFQAAYQASAKVVSAADEMLRTLISL